MHRCCRRFGWTGPLPAVRQFLSEHPNFESDRSRELLFTDHSFGYLKRSS
jgi:cephalosporin hydroxylase